MEGEQQQQTKPCPFCGEQILSVAIKCKHCGSDLTSSAAAASGSKSEALGILMLVLPLIGSALVWFWIANMNLLQGPRSALGIVLCAVILGTATLAAVEASQLGMGSVPNSKGKKGAGPMGWFLSTALLWIACYPAYLFERSRHGAKNLVVGGVIAAAVFAGSAFMIERAIEAKIEQIQSNPIAAALLNVATQTPTEPTTATGSPIDRRTAMVEAAKNLRMLADSSISFFEAEHADSKGNILPQQFPPSSALTPSRSCCEQGGECRPSADAFSGETWVALNFSFDDPFHFQYEYVSSGTGKSSKFTARAVGDIGCSGRRVVLERGGYVGADNNVVITPLKTNE